MTKPTIELTERMIKKEKTKKHFNKFWWFLTKTLVLLFVWVTAANYTTSAYIASVDYAQKTIFQTKTWMYSRLNVIEKSNEPQIDLDGVVPEQLDSVKVGELVKSTADKYNINPAILLAMIDQESGFVPTRIRFEQKWKEQYKGKWKQGSMTNIEYDLLFSSIGLMQIGYGLHREECSIKTFTDLFYAEKNIECGSIIIRTCLDRNASLRPSVRVRTCIKEFNGSGPAADQYAAIIMDKISDYLIENSKEKLFVEAYKPNFMRLSYNSQKNTKSYD